MNSFDLVISSALKKIYKGKAVHCRAVTPVGSIGIEARHEPFNTVLVNGSNIEYETDRGEVKSVTVKTALLSFKDNICTIAAELKDIKK